MAPCFAACIFLLRRLSDSHAYCLGPTNQIPGLAVPSLSSSKHHKAFRNPGLGSKSWSVAVEALPVLIGGGHPKLFFSEGYGF